MAGLFIDVIGLGLDDPRRQPKPIDAVSNHGTQQVLSDDLRVPVEECVVEMLCRGFGEAVHRCSGFGKSACSDRISGANIPQGMGRSRAGRQTNAVNKDGSASLQMISAAGIQEAPRIGGAS